MLRDNFHNPKLLVSIILLALVSVAALLLERSGIPALLSALLLGTLVNAATDTMADHKRIEKLSGPFLQFGIALLGLRISTDDIVAIGAERALVIGAIVLVTLATGFALARLLGLNHRVGFLAGIGTAICGATAILAATLIHPKDPRDKDEIGILVIGIVMLSTAAMLIYPGLAILLSLNDLQAGILLGGSIQNVPQAIGAGFSFSPSAGETASLTKMFRVSMLAPILFLSAFTVNTRNKAGFKIVRKSVPTYLLMFICLAILASTGIVPTGIRTVVSHISAVLLLIGLAAIGLGISLKNFVSGGASVLFLLALNALALMLMLLCAIWADLL